MSKKTHTMALTISAAQQTLLLNAPTLCLVGLMGSGKSTVGRILANTLKRSFCDSDEEVVRRTGASIPTIFEIEGEQGFREREAKVIRELCTQPAMVLATGGGAVLREDSRQVIRSNCTVIYLSTTPERLLMRTRYDRNRPLLQNSDPLSTLKKLHNIRHPIYSEMADIIVTTGAGQVAQVAAHIIEALTQKMMQN